MALTTATQFKGFMRAGDDALAAGDKVTAFNLLFIDKALRHKEYRHAIQAGEIRSM
mgnify:FL=1